MVQLSNVLRRVFNIISFFILRLLVIELFPTVSRGTGLGLCVVAEMSGGLLTPLFVMLKVSEKANENIELAAK